MGARAHPFSTPYVPFRTSPYDHYDQVNDKITIFEDWAKRWPPTDGKRAATQAWNELPKTHCPLQFSLGYSKHHSSSSRLPSSSLRQPPILTTVFPSQTATRQVVYTTVYEHLQVLTPAELTGTSSSTVKQVLVEATGFPLLLESSAFAATHPLVHDINGDGIADALVVDYDGGLSMAGLASKPSAERFWKHVQIPRLYIRQDWVAGRLLAEEQNKAANDEEQHPDSNETEPEKLHDPYHSYFEYYYADDAAAEELLRGVPANEMDQDAAELEALQERRQRRLSNPHGEESQPEVSQPDGEEEERHRRRLQETDQEAVWQHDLGAVVPDPETVEASTDAQSQEESSNGEAQSADIINNPNDNASEQQQQQQTEQRQEEQSQDNTAQNDIPEQQQEQQDQESGTAADNEKPEPGILDLSGFFPAEEEAAVEENGEDAMDDAFYTRDDDAYEQEDDHARHGDDDYIYTDDPDYGRYGSHDDYYGLDQAHEEYYDTKQYIRVPPHVLANPTFAELPKPYSDLRETEEILYIPVTYYFDEDEYEGFSSYKRFSETDRGDETEARRGSYVASAILTYVLASGGTSGRWSSQTHLDLSTDFTAPENVTVVDVVPVQADTTKLGAFALSSPTVADLDGDGTTEVLMGTSMGMVYALDARHLYERGQGWPVQLPFPIESRIVVEDVVGNTDLEVLVADIGGNVVCFDAQAKPVWRRNILDDLKMKSHENMQASSPMALGDIDGNGSLDVVMTVEIEGVGFVMAYDAASGNPIAPFPLELTKREFDPARVSDLHGKIAQPLLIDLHGDQSHITEYIRRGGGPFQRLSKASPKFAPPGGSASGLHIVQPIHETLFVIEAGSGCTQALEVGDAVHAMVQADDVHGTNKMDLVVSTVGGKVITLESESPWHPLNTWTNGELRGRENAHAHGYSASQGIFVVPDDSNREVWGIYVPVTFEIFDNRPNITHEPERRKYQVEIRDGSSAQRALWRKSYNATGQYTERVYIRYGPGYYRLNLVMRTSHGLVYEDSWSVRYNIHFMEGFGMLLLVPLLLASAVIVLGRKRSWDDDDEPPVRDTSGLGILGRAVPR